MLMSFFEVETWKPKAGHEVEHDETIRQWFAYVKEHHDAMFPEWKSAQYFRQVLRDKDEQTGRYIMVFGYHSHEGFAAYKDRRRDWSGPYAEYKKLDPYRLFIPESVTVTHWQPQEESRWLDWHPTTPTSFFDVVSWTPLEGFQEKHDDIMRHWFAFVETHHDELFPEWQAAHYFRGTDHDTGEPTNRFMMVFEYNHREGFLAYKERRKDYAGPYAEYLKTDPFIYFDMATKTQVFWQPHELSLWLDFTKAWK
jgi:hypothetical protein